jgi:hypothetical protein
MLNQIYSFFESLKVFWQQLLLFIPQLLMGILLFIIGWFLAKLLRNGIKKILQLVRMDIVAEKAGIEQFLIKGGTQYSTINLVANIAYWFIMFGLILAILHSLGLDMAKELFNKLLLYIPNVITAILVLIFGTLFAKLLRETSSTYLTNVRITGAEFISTIIYWAIILLIVSIALQQLAIGGRILLAAFEIAFGGFCLALAIAFGLAGKEWATQILEKLWRNSR